MADITNSSMIIFGVLWVVLALIHLILVKNGLCAYEMERLIQKQTNVPLATSKTLFSATLGCLLIVPYLITRSAQNFYIYVDGIDYEEDDLAAQVTFIIASVGVGAIWYSVATFGVLAIKTLILAKHGIAGTRKMWFVIFEKYLGIGTATVVLFFFATNEISVIFAVLPENIGVYFSASVFFLFGIVYFFITLKFRSVSKEATEQHNITQMCREIYWIATTVVIASTYTVILYMRLRIDNVKIYNIRLRIENKYQYLLWVGYVTNSLMIFMLIRFIATINQGAQNAIQVHTTLDPDPATNNAHHAAHVPHSTDIPITNVDLTVIGSAPLAPRPTWLPTTGAGQSTVEPGNWSISLENWTRFMRACMDTDTWACLVAAKQERNINMYDMKDHFIVPWTCGTGCSVADLVKENQGSVELMISHAWTGSVTETISAMESVLCMYSLPKETRIFFDSLCLYQAEDNAAFGLSIAQQLVQKPFALIIERKPTHGMFVVHTTISEVYDRLWCVHEMDECLVVGLNTFGVFDLASWDNNKLKLSTTSVKTCDADCQGKDKAMLTNLINFRGGFDRLDNEIRKVRQQSMKDLATAHLFKRLFGTDISSIDRFTDNQV